MMMQAKWSDLLVKRKKGPKAKETGGHWKLKKAEKLILFSDPPEGTVHTLILAQWDWFQICEPQTYKRVFVGSFNKNHWVCGHLS